MKLFQDAKALLIRGRQKVSEKLHNHCQDQTPAQSPADNVNADANANANANATTPSANPNGGGFWDKTQINTPATGKAPNAKGKCWDDYVEEVNPKGPHNRCF